MRSEVGDGVWRIAPGRGSQWPNIELLSPFIGEDSALFDRVTLRLRLLYHSPTDGSIEMRWFNSERRRLHEMQERVVGMSFVEHLLPVFTTDWQELTIALDREGMVWQDSLFYFELSLALNGHAEGLADFPDLEVDWIQLTGPKSCWWGSWSPRRWRRRRGRPCAVGGPCFFASVGGR